MTTDRRPARHHSWLLAFCLVLAGCGAAATTSADPRASNTPLSPTPRPSPTATAKPVSWLTHSTLVTFYGRGFNDAPILGRLGFFRGFDDMAKQIQPYINGIRPNNRHHRILIAVHLIYAIATSCGGPTDRCLDYLDASGVNLVRDYILPAQRRGWLVILDDQLARSDPVNEMRRLIAKGYLRYDNVEVAMDPEFRATPNQPTPGIPVGSVLSSEINKAQEILNGYAKSQHLRHRKVFIIHQFQQGMIQRRERLEHNQPYVDPVVMADGFGDPVTKAQVYEALLGNGASHGVVWRGLKLFFPNPYEHAGHFDNPVLGWREVFGWSSVMDATGYRYFIRPPPDVICIA